MPRTIKGTAIFAPRTEPSASQGMVLFNSSEAKFKVSNDGSSFSGVSGGVGGTPYWDGITVEDFFKLSQTSGTFTFLASDGTTQVKATASSNSVVSVHANVNQWTKEQGKTFEILAFVDSTVDPRRGAFGFGRTTYWTSTGDILPATFGSGAYLRMSNISGNMIYENSTSTGTTTSTNTTFPNGVYNRISIVLSSTSVTFYRNETLVATHTTNLPNQAMDAGFNSVSSPGNSATPLVAAPLWSVIVR